MSKIINGRTYTHQTQESPPEYARLICDDLLTPKETQVWALLDNGEEAAIIYFSDLVFVRERPSKMDLTPIPEQKVVAWTFETCPRDLVVRNRTKSFSDERILAFNDRNVISHYTSCGYDDLNKYYDRVMPDGSLVPCGVVQ